MKEITPRSHGSYITSQSAFRCHLAAWWVWPQLVSHSEILASQSNHTDYTAHGARCGFNWWLILLTVNNTWHFVLTNIWYYVQYTIMVDLQWKH